MAQSGFTSVQIYRSTTAAAVPLAADLAAGELAINIADMKLYAKNSAGAVTLLSSAGATGDVVGPASATNNNLAAFDGTTGKLIKQAAVVTVAQGGTGTATPSLVAGTNITITGSFPNQTINSSGGGGGDLLENNQVISTNYTVTSAKNALAVGPITINTGISVTVGTGQRWLVLN